MTSLIVARGPVTDSLIDFLTTQLAEAAQPILVGDGEKDPAAGWEGGQPGQGKYTAHVTIATNPAQAPLREPQVLSGQHSGWDLGYKLQYFGATRTQADWCADVVRNIVVGFDTGYLPAEFGWSIESVIYPGLGAVNRNEAVSPPEWSILEEARIRITRSRRS